ncbi:hypothetical protein GCM10022202_35800 [Microbacterium marinilacus]|uniref:Uncharacterized protein n=1 Tax=Microbacterium marinilacus TaxID=415209 RepID=A0ABP7BWT2_9MICO
MLLLAARDAYAPRSHAVGRTGSRAMGRAPLIVTPAPVAQEAELSHSTGTPPRWHAAPEG